jgi:hypothetical protein
MFKPAPPDIAGLSSLDLRIIHRYPGFICSYANQRSLFAGPHRAL